ncbi:MAG TPA: hypothetical protein VHQ01_05295, partial [Pyrinomonadaceae bacterium]|nr:hypothetical protein [Pyrinomonadaceae bacterium]
MNLRPKRSYAILFVVLASILALSSYFFVSRPTQAETALPPDKTTPAGKLIADATTGLPAVAPLTMNFVRSPDTDGPGGKGRYLIAVNSGYGLEFNSKSKPQQSLSVIDLAAAEPKVVQNIYFPAPQSANFGLAFDPKLQSDGKYRMYVSGGFENKIWILGFDAKAALPVSPQTKPDETVKAPAIDIAAFAENAPSSNYNDNTAAVYPTGIALSPDGETVYSANNLGDTLGVVSDLRDSRKLTRISLRRPGSEQFVYPYDVETVTNGKRVSKIYVSLWGDGSIASVNPAAQNRVTHIAVGRHPTAMLLNKAQTRLLVVNSNADTVSVIDTAADRLIETINVRLAESEQIGASPEGLALSDDEKTLFVANAHANAVAVVGLTANPTANNRSKLLGFIPTGKYASAVAVVGSHIFIANGKGTGMDNSSVKVNESGFYPNMPNKDFPGDTYNKRGN